MYLPIFYLPIYILLSIAFIALSIDTEKLMHFSVLLDIWSLYKNNNLTHYERTKDLRETEYLKLQMLCAAPQYLPVK